MKQMAWVQMELWPNGVPWNTDRVLWSMEGDVEIPNLVEIVIAPGVMSGLIKALEVQYTQYKEAYEREPDED